MSKKIIGLSKNMKIQSLINSNLQKVIAQNNGPYTTGSQKLFSKIKEIENLSKRINNKKILVLGASGHLGSHIMRIMKIMGFSENVIGCSHRKESKGLIKLPIIDNQQLSRDLKIFINEHNPSIIINATALANPVTCNENEALATLLNHTFAAELSKYSETSKIIHLSTEAVYDRTEMKNELSENAAINMDENSNRYVLSKYEGEKIFKGKPNSLILRLPNLIGEGSTSAAYSIYERLLQNENISYIQNEYRMFGSTYEVAASIILAAMKMLDNEALSGETINLLGPKQTTKYELINMIAEVNAIDNVKIRVQQDIPYRIKRYLLSTTKSHSFNIGLNITPKEALVLMRTGLQKNLKYKGSPIEKLSID